MPSNMSGGSISWSATMDPSGFVKGAQKLRSESKGLADDLKQSFGSHGPMASLAKLAQGGAILAGINVAIDAMKKMAEETTKLNSEMANSHWTKGQVFSGFATSGLKAVPVLGRIVEAGEAIHDLFDGIANGKPFAQLAEDARNFEATIGGMRDTMDGIARGIRDVRGKDPLNAIQDQLEDSKRHIIDQRTAGLRPGISDAAERQIFQSSNTAMAMAEKLAAEQRAALAEKANLDKSTNWWKDAWRTKANTVNYWLTNMTKDLDEFHAREAKHVDANTALWKDRLTTLFNTVAHDFMDLENNRDKFNAAKAKKERDRLAHKAAIDNIVDVAIGLRDQARAEAPRFAGATLRGSQEAISAVNISQAGQTKSEKSADDLVKLAIKQLDEQRKARAAFERAAEKQAPTVRV